MGYDFHIDGWYSIKDDQKKYPWPCVSEPSRKIRIFSGDVLTHLGDGTFMKHTGLGCTNIIIPEEDLIHHESRVNLVME